MRFWMGVFFGALAMALYAYRQQISDVINNRSALSAGAKTAQGVEQAVAGAKELIHQLDGGGP